MIRNRYRSSPLSPKAKKKAEFAAVDREESIMHVKGTKQQIKLDEVDPLNRRFMGK